MGSERRTPASIVVAAGTVLALGLSACTVSSSDRLPPPTLSDLTPLSEEEAYEQQRTSAIEGFETMHPGVPVPAIEFVRFVTPEEWAAVTAECMTAAGFTATVSDDGGVEYGGIPVDQAVALDLASLECRLQHPMDPRYSAPLSAYQIQYLYEYYVYDLVPCLEDEGFDIDEAPSFQVYAETYDTEEMWTPYSRIAIDGRASDWDALNVRCPQAPADLFG